VVEFQDQQTQLSARNLAACLAKEAGKHAWIIAALCVCVWEHV